MSGTPNGRLSSTYFGTNPDALGAQGGSQSVNLLIANLNTFRPTVNSWNITGTGTVPVTGITLINGNNDAIHLPVSNNANASLGTVSVISTAPTGGTVTMDTLGLGTPSATVQPTLTANCMIRVLAMLDTRMSPHSLAANDNLQPVADRRRAAWDSPDADR